MAPFTGEARDILKRRAGGKSEISGDDTFPLHRMHKDHSKENPLHNDPENGIVGTMVEHFVHHLLHRGRANEIGMSEKGNEWAIDMLNRNMIDVAERKGLLGVLTKFVKKAIKDLKEKGLV